MPNRAAQNRLIGGTGGRSEFLDRCRRKKTQVVDEAQVGEAWLRYSRVVGGSEKSGVAGDATM